MRQAPAEPTRPGLFALFAMLIAVIAARIVATRRVVAAIVSVRLRVAVCWVAVAVRGIAITVGPRRQRAGDHTGGDPGTNPAADASRFGRLRHGRHRCSNAAGGG